MTATEPHPPVSPSPYAADSSTTEPAPADSQPEPKLSGEFVELAGTRCYLTRPTHPPSTGTPLLLHLTTGHALTPENLGHSDTLAHHGFLVLTPDLFHADPVPSVTAPPPLPQDSGLLDQLGYGLLAGAKGFQLDMWLARHPPESKLSVVKKVLEAAKEKYGEQWYTPALGTRVMGYGYGGKVGVLLAGEAGEECGVSAVAVGSPMEVTVADVHGAKKPMRVDVGEGEAGVGENVLEEAEKAKGDGKDMEVKVWRGMPAGFTVPNRDGEDDVKEEREECVGEMVEFLERY